MQTLYWLAPNGRATGVATGLRPKFNIVQVVKRAAAKVRDEAELYPLNADEIKDVNERKAFVRKAVQASRKR